MELRKRKKIAKLVEKRSYQKASFINKDVDHQALPLELYLWDPNGEGENQPPQLFSDLLEGIVALLYPHKCMHIFIHCLINRKKYTFTQ